MAKAKESSNPNLAKSALPGLVVGTIVVVGIALAGRYFTRKQ